MIIRAFFGKCAFCFAIVIALCNATVVKAQGLSNLRKKTIAFTPGDTISLDTLSILPGTFHVFQPSGASIPDPGWIEVDFPNATMLFRQPTDLPTPDSIVVMYRVFPILLTKPVINRSREIIEKDYQGLYNPYAYSSQSTRESFFQTDGLSKNGNISRGISFGNNQDVVVNSSFNLQLSGKLSDDVEILAAITDNNIPVQPDGNTQQIQDFDKVFIQLSRNKSKLIAGDFEIQKPPGYFMNYFKKGQGALVSSEYSVSKKSKAEMSTMVSGAVSKGKYARNVIAGIEANQGPYRLTGSENETFIIVLSNTEKVFIDGVELKRGENFDYVIDYNTAELTFMPKVPITKDKRIVVEFQYSDKNYARTMFVLNQQFKSEKLQLNANVYSEQDSKNQPLLQDLRETDKLLLASVGDSINDAVVPNIDSVAFSDSEVLYEKLDSLGFTVYKYSTDSTKAHFRLGFSYVGPGRGNYIPESSSANGRVYKWVAPVSGILQGSYEPVIQLIAPRRQRMVTLGGKMDINKNNTVFLETAYTNYDVNLFSSKDKANDNGYAVYAGYDNNLDLNSSEKKKISLTTGVKFEHISENFIPIEQYRPIEFTRDWNLGTGNYTGQEDLGSIKLSLINAGFYNISYTFKTFLKGSDYTGLMNMLDSRVSTKTFSLISRASYLSTDAIASKTNFIRSFTDLSNKFGAARIGIIYDQEYNLIKDATTDDIQLNSYSYDKMQVYVSSSDTSKIRYRLETGRRYDSNALAGKLKGSTVADEAGGQAEFIINPRNRLKLTASYRNLTVTDTAVTKILPEETFLSRLEYNTVLLKGMISSQTIYEVGTGQELKREYAFVEVAPGTGTHTYAGDYNGNGVKDLDEFEIAAFSDQADYIKVYIPTNEYVKSRTNQFGEVLTLNPAAFLDQSVKLNKFISRFSNTTTYRVENKTLDDDIARSLNPFRENIEDTSLISTNSAFRNTLAFNRSASKFGIDFTILNNRNKALLTNGYEARKLGSYIFNTRWNITKVYSIQLRNEFGEKSNRSDFFSSRDYVIKYQELEPRFSIQPGISFRATLSYKLSIKENTFSDLEEKATQNNGGIELKYSSVKKGIALARFNLINIDYNASENTSIAYEMLDGLRKGTNLTWGLSFQRNLGNNIQINLNYDGRKSEGTSPVHIGSVQARAYF